MVTAGAGKSSTVNDVPCHCSTPWFFVIVNIVGSICFRFKQKKKLIF
jgi:hypothetical protein